MLSVRKWQGSPVVTWSCVQRWLFKCTENCFAASHSSYCLSNSVHYLSTDCTYLKTEKKSLKYWNSEQKKKKKIPNLIDIFNSFGKYSTFECTLQVLLIVILDGKGVCQYLFPTRFPVTGLPVMIIHWPHFLSNVPPKWKGLQTSALLLKWSNL